MRVYKQIVFIFFVAFAHGGVCQQVAPVSDTQKLVSVLQAKPEYGGLIDAMSEIDVLESSGAPKKKIVAAVNELIKRVRFTQKYSADDDLDLVLAWCAARKGQPIKPQKRIASPTVIAALTDSSVDDFAIALSEKPEYAELFELFVDVQVLIAENAPVQKIRPAMQRLIKRIEFVKKYAQDQLLDDLHAWCYAQKGCSKKSMAAWKKALIAVAAVVAAGITAGSLVYRKRRQQAAVQQAQAAAVQQAQAEAAQQAPAVAAQQAPAEVPQAEVAQQAGNGFVMVGPHGQLLHHPGVEGGGGLPGAGVVVGEDVEGGAALQSVPRHYYPYSLGECLFTDKLGALASAACSLCRANFVRGDRCCMDTAGTHAMHQACLQNAIISQTAVRCPSCRAAGYSHYFRFMYPHNLPIAAPGDRRSNPKVCALSSATEMASFNFAGSGGRELSLIRSLRVPARLPDCVMFINAISYEDRSLGVVYVVQKVLDRGLLPGDLSDYVVLDYTDIPVVAEMIFDDVRYVQHLPLLGASGVQSGKNLWVYRRRVNEANSGGNSSAVGPAAERGDFAGRALRSMPQEIDGILHCKLGPEKSFTAELLAQAGLQNMPPANSLVKIGSAVVYVSTFGKFQAIPTGVFTGDISEYELTNERSDEGFRRSHSNYIKRAQFKTEDNDTIFIYRKNVV